MLKDSQLGIQSADAVRRVPAVSAISGKALKPGSVFIPFPDSAYTIGVQGHEWRRMSAVEKQAFQAEMRKQLPAEPVTEAAPDTSPIEAMSSTELDALATAEGIDLTGRRSKQDKIDKITTDRMFKRLGGALDTSADTSVESEAD